MDEDVFFIVAVNNHNNPAEEKAKDFGYILKLNAVFNKKQAISNKHDIEDIKGFQKNIFGFKLKNIQEELIEVTFCIADPENTELGKVNLPTGAFKLGCFYKLDLMFKPSSKRFTDINVHLNVCYSKKPSMKNTFKSVEWSKPNSKLIRKANTFEIFDSDGTESHPALNKEKLLAVIAAMRATPAENWTILSDPVFLFSVSKYIQGKSKVQIFQPNPDFTPKYETPKPSNVPSMSILPNPTGFSIPRQKITEMIAAGGISKITVDNIRKQIIEGQANDSEPEFPEIPDYIPETPKPDTSRFIKTTSVSEALGIRKDNNGDTTINTTINPPINETINMPINETINHGNSPIVNFDSQLPPTSGPIWIPQNTASPRRPVTPSQDLESPQHPNSQANNMSSLISGANPYGNLITQAQQSGLITNSNPYGDLQTEVRSDFNISTSSNPYGNLVTELPPNSPASTPNTVSQSSQDAENPYGNLRTEAFPPPPPNAPILPEMSMPNDGLVLPGPSAYSLESTTASTFNPDI